MNDIKRKLEEFLSKTRSYFLESNQADGKNQNKRKKWLNLSVVLFLFFISLFVLLSLIETNSDSNIKKEEESIEKQEGMEQKIELGTNAVKGDIKWQNFLEESIEIEGKTREEQIKTLKNILDRTKEENKEESEREFSELKNRLSYALREIEAIKLENRNFQDEMASIKSDDQENVLSTELDVININDNKRSIRTPVSSFNYIPATSYVKGKLLGGIVVSTSVNSSSEPIPVVIRLTSRGNLPRDFAVDISQCRLLASCYGDISSESAIIRAEELVCEDKEAGLMTTTKVAGVIYGDDGANGIRGSVVSMSDKHLKNVAIGGVLSGFANTAKGQDGLNFSALGVASTKQKGIKEMAEDGVLKGVSGAAEKLADYHIKLAENISPVILVPGGTEVNVVFTKSVEISSVDVEEVINSEREAR